MAAWTGLQLLFVGWVCSTSAIGHTAERSRTTAVLNNFAAQFWSWRSVTSPITSDDLPRTAVVRPTGWAPNVSKEAFMETELRYERFVTLLREIRYHPTTVPFDQWSTADQSDYWALTSALARVYWELHIFAPHERDPGYYLQQAYGSVWDCLVSTSTGWNEEVIASCLLPRISAATAVFVNGRLNLQEGNPTAELGELYLQTVSYNSTTGASPLGQQMEASIAAVVAACNPKLSPKTTAALTQATRASADALSGMTDFVQTKLQQRAWSGATAVGVESYLWFLRHVSFVNLTTDELTAIGRQQLSRADTMLVFEKRRNDASGLPPAVPLAKDLESQIAATHRMSDLVKQFLRDNEILNLPEWFGADTGYRVDPIPPWLSPFGYSDLGEEDDFTSAAESRQQANFMRFVPPPRTGMPFFLDSLARDARPVIVHEGIPGHYTQFRYSWRNSRQARRHWLDSIANEGLAYYFEETLLHAGLFDSTPRLRETMFEFMRLRAIRVEADVGLATGSLSVDEAVQYFVTQVPMSPEEASSEVLARLAAPAQGLSYVIGKVQLFGFLHSERIRLGHSFNLTQFHTSLEYNGNLPFALQQHSAGLEKIDLGFENLFSAYEGVANVHQLSQVVRDETLVRQLPGQPAGSRAPLFSGYEDVAGGDRSLFYLLAHSTEPDSHEVSVPLVVWLQGGNGCSSLIGAFTENGPFSAPNDRDSPQRLRGNQYSMNRLAHVLYLDRPAGSGYS